MNAYELFEAYNDNARGCDDPALGLFGFEDKPERSALEAAIDAYAEGACDIALKSGIAGKIADCMLAYHDAMQESGEYSNNHDNCITLPLEEIEL